MMNRFPKLEELIVSALMHDIGKFAQRASCIADTSIEQSYCPWNGKYYTHKHSIYGHPFLNSQAFPLPKELEAKRSDIARYASAHHKAGVSPDAQGKMLEHIITLADRLSSGLDRIKDEEQENNFKTAHLQSIFAEVSLKQKEVKTSWHSLQALGVENDIFPTAQKDAKPTDYPNLWRAFTEELQSIPCDEGFTAYLSSLISVLEKYTYCIPSCTYGTKADISLFDHSITTASIAQSLYASVIENDVQAIEALKSQGFILFAAELSGIQKYIFTGKGGKGYAKILRARSFHLQTITRAVLLHIVDTLGLHSVAKIMDAGGKFILLLPSTASVKEHLTAIQKQLDVYFAKEFFGELKLLTAGMQIKQDGMLQEHFIAKLDAINDELEKKKLSVAKHYLHDASPVFDASFPHGICDFCERNAADPQYSDSESNSCPLCHALVEIGKVLPRAQYGLFTKEPSYDGKSIKVFNDIYLYLNDKPFARSDVQKALETISIKSRGKYSSYPIAGHMPYKEEHGEPYSFEDLADAARHTDTADGVSMLGAFKADVDNLGLLFSVGFGDGLSVSRFAMLSRMLNTFFSEHLVRVIKRENLNIYTVFTGGDDLFVLGAWTDIVRFASLVHQDFAAFTGHNPNVTLSAGIALCKPKLPIARIASMAEENLEHAKKSDQRAKSVQGQGEKIVKNACTIFEVTCSWQDFEKQMKQAEWLEDSVRNQTVTYGLVRRLLHYSSECKLFQNTGKMQHGLYISHMQYDLARNVQDEALRDAILLMATPDTFQHSRIAISHAIYNTRK